jgi:hypothetical protein
MIVTVMVCSYDADNAHSWCARPSFHRFYLSLIQHGGDNGDDDEQRGNKIVCVRATRIVVCVCVCKTFFS